MSVIISQDLLFMCGRELAQYLSPEVSEEKIIIIKK